MIISALLVYEAAALFQKKNKKNDHQHFVGGCCRPFRAFGSWEDVDGGRTFSL